MEKSAMEHDHGICEKVKVESLRKLFNKDLLIGQINIRGTHCNSQDHWRLFNGQGADKTKQLRIVRQTECRNDRSYKTKKITD